MFQTEKKDEGNGREPTTAEERAAALKIHGCDDIQVDEDAMAVRVERGVWVQAWVWVPAEED